MKSNKPQKPKSATWGKKFLTVCSLILSCSLAFPESAKVSKDLEGKNTSEPVDVIVQYHRAPTALNHQKVLSRGGTFKRELGLINGRVYTVPAWAIKDLADDPDVVYVSPDRPLRGTTNGNPTAVNDFHTGTINAPAAWAQGLNGTGVGVAIIDSGMINIPDFNNQNVVYSENFVGGTSGSANDQFGHGTHVAGIIAGNGNKSTGSNYTYTFMGIAPDVNIVNLRVLDQNGMGTDSQVIQAIQEAISLKTTYNIRVINLSLGRGVYESYTVDPLCQAVEQAWNAGIVVVVAAGNGGRDTAANTDGYGTITAPGNDPYAITVGAMNTMGTPSRTDDVPASYSSKGPTLWDQVAKPDLVAPGNLVISLYTAGLTLNQEVPGNEIPNSLYQVNGNSTASDTYFILSGTSMAAPMVTGAVALMLQQTPSLTPDQVKARLMLSAFKGLQTASTAKDLSTGQVFNMQADLFTVGAGYLDIQAALASTALAPATVGSAMSPTTSVDSNGNVVLVTGTSVIWGKSVLWGKSAVWGSTVFNGTDVQGNSILWGTGTLEGNSVLWGTTKINPSSVTAGASVLWGKNTSSPDDQAGFTADQP